MDDLQKYKAISLLEQELEPKDIAEQLDLSYSGVLKLKKDFNQAKENNTVNQLVNMDNVLLNELAEHSPIIEENLDRVTKGLDGLEVLNTELQKTALQIVRRVNSLLMSADMPSEIETYADIVCNMQTTFFNKNMTQVNVQNNFGSENTSASRYSQYLNDAPGNL